MFKNIIKFCVAELGKYGMVALTGGATAACAAATLYCGKSAVKAAKDMLEDRNEPKELEESELQK